MQDAIAQELFGTEARTALGRFVLLDVLGAGGMGFVYRAYDPVLDRAVAVKVLHDAGDPQLLREAKSMARLSHPNIVAVHEVGQHEGATFVAMELVAGGTLRTLCRSQPSIDALVELMLQVGRGLAAAHAAGLIHRDIKPDNILLTEQGQAKIGDFGLARTPAGLPTESLAIGEAARDTTAGGTPAYMAPEQFEGRTDARSDQFSLCVTFFEAFYGRRPFMEDSTTNLGSGSRTEQRVEVPSSREIPRWLSDVIERGLSVEPAARFPSIEAVVEAIERGRRGGRPRRVGLAVGAVVAGLAAAGFLALREPVCTDGSALLSAEWNPVVRARMRDGFAASGFGAWEWAHGKVASDLDGFVAGWGEAHRQACEDPSPARSACLDDARAGFLAALDALESPTASKVQRSTSAVLSLPTPADCHDASAVDEVSGDARAEAGAALARGEVLRVLWQRTEARVALEDAVSKAERAGVPAVAAAAWVGLSALQAEAGQEQETLRSGRRALLEAEASENDGVVADAWRNLGATAGRFEHHDEADFYLERGLSLAGRHPARLAREHAQLLGTLGRLRNATGRFEDAVDLFEQAIARHEELGASREAVASLRTVQCGALKDLGRVDDAIAAGDEAIRALEALHGPDHPMLVAPLANLGHVYAERKEQAMAIELLSRAVTIANADPEHAPENRVLVNVSLANALYEAGRYPEARTVIERVRAVDVPRLPPMHSAALNATLSVANLEIAERRYQAAADTLGPLVEKTQDDPTVWSDVRCAAMLSLAVALSHLDGHAEAAELLRKARGVEHVPAGLRQRIDAIAANVTRRAEEARRSTASPDRP